MTATPSPAGDTPAPRPLLTDWGWDRELLGRLVRQAWVAYCSATGDTKPSHIAAWDVLSEWDQEADRVIGETVARAVRQAIIVRIGQALNGGGE